MSKRPLSNPSNEQDIKRVKFSHNEIPPTEQTVKRVKFSHDTYDEHIKSICHRLSKLELDRSSVNTSDIVPDTITDICADVKKLVSKMEHMEKMIELNNLVVNDFIRCCQRNITQNNLYDYSYIN